MLYDETATEFQKAARSAWFGLSALLRYDVLHYYFGTTFLYTGYAFEGVGRMGPLLKRLVTIDLQLAKGWAGSGS